MNDTNLSVEGWVNFEDVAEYLSLSKDTVRNWIKDGKLPAYRAGKMYKFKISEIDQWMREGRLGQEPSND
ncbi:MAG: helix-turn-helix domain-containing protein [Corynebacterium sp.]|nr:helix-turn-helix domain-containing protein [Corynebacterium sp.]